MSQLRVYGSGLEGRPMWVTLGWVSAAEHLISKKEMRPSSGNWETPYVAGPGPHRGFELIHYLLEVQHKQSSRFPECTDDNETFPGPGRYKQGRTGRGGEGQGPDLAAVTMTWRTSGSQEKGTSQIAGS